MKARRAIAAAVVVALVAGAVYSWARLGPRLQNEFTFVNFTTRDVASVRVEFGSQPVEFGPVPADEEVTVGVPIGASGDYYVTVVFADGTVGGYATGPGNSRLFGQRIVWTIFDNSITIKKSSRG